ncbi:MAG: sodium:solute symporter [Bacteroidales bacterium]|nr:sodium:solute symporter [Bacteroidales bacterium]
MKPELILIIIFLYFGALLIISQVTGKGADNEAFYLGNRRSPWYIVAFGMIGASLSGVTFISVPGWVITSQMTYMQMVLGYLAGYIVIANVLMPLFYKMELTSIYTYLNERFGKITYKTGASLFMVSRIIGASFRLFLVARVLHISVFNHWNVPFWATVVITILLIWFYTNKGGIKTIIWTDTLQTFSMLTAVIITFIFIGKKMGLDLSGTIETISRSDFSKIWEFGTWKNGNHFLQHFFSGMFITIVMTGLDQDMMQKNLSCRNIKEAKKNMYWMSISLIPVNLLFLSLGVLLATFAIQSGIGLPEKTDDLFPMLVTGGMLPQVVGITFVIGLLAAAYSSADSALTALTTSFTVDILDNTGLDEAARIKRRKRVHIAISIILAIVIFIFEAINNESVISAIFKVAGFTYGPLLGLYAFGLFTKRQLTERWVPFVAVLAPIAAYIDRLILEWLISNYEMGFEFLIMNGLYTFMGLWIISQNQQQRSPR